MQDRIVDISSDNAHLSVYRGFLKIGIDGAAAGQVAIVDMAALIIRGHGASFSANICARLADANVPIVICGANQSPVSVIWPLAGHFSQGIQMQAQAAAKKPLLKRLWTQLVKTKIQTQAQVLKARGLDCGDLLGMAGRVRSGDPQNLEAQAARRYWPRLMGTSFIRDRHQDGVNSALNYGYTILRAATARSILGAGLHPSLSLQHQSRGNPLRLADDLMEPFRPWIDLAVFDFVNGLDKEAEFSLDKDRRSALVDVLTLDLQSSNGMSPMQVCMDRLAQSLAKVFLGECGDMELPGPPLSLSL